jgi:hypothetical protein
MSEDAATNAVRVMREATADHISHDSLVRPANEEMVQGYLDGRDPNNPEPSLNRSASYRHGFGSGRADLGAPPRGTFDEIRRMAQAAMDEDEARTRLRT